MTKSDLVELIKLARITPSAMNMQSLKYKLVIYPTECEQIFPLLGWAGYLEDWPGPKPGERPPAYIIVLCDTSIGASYNHDKGIAAQTILLGATEKGLGGYFIANIEKDKFSSALDIDSECEVLIVLPIGKPKEEVVLAPMRNDDVKYWRDDNGVHHVPKRDLGELIL